jgi:hypothetical protein
MKAISSSPASLAPLRSLLFFSMRTNSPLLPTGTIATPPARLRMPAAEWNVGRAAP